MIFLIWSGWGFLSILIVILTSMVVGGILQTGLTAIGRSDLTFLAISLGLFAAAAVNWFIGKKLNSVKPRLLVDPATGEQVTLQRLNKLFWIRMEYWSIPVAILGFVPLLALFGK